MIQIIPNKGSLNHPQSAPLLQSAPSKFTQVILFELLVFDKMSMRAPSWEISTARDPKNFDTLDSISAKLDYMLWYTFLDKEQETLVKPKFVSQRADSVHKYKARFEEWKSVVWARELDVPESYFVSVFISGLREEIRVLVQESEPLSVSHAWAIAALQETNLQSIHKKPKVGLIPSSTEKNSSISLQNCDLSGQKWKEKVAPEIGLLRPTDYFSRENQETGPQIGINLEENVVLDKEELSNSWSTEIDAVQVTQKDQERELEKDQGYSLNSGQQSSQIEVYFRVELAPENEFLVQPFSSKRINPPRVDKLHTEFNFGAENFVHYNVGLISEVVIKEKGLENKENPCLGEPKVEAISEVKTLVLRITNWVGNKINEDQEFSSKSDVKCGLVVSADAEGNNTVKLANIQCFIEELKFIIKRPDPGGTLKVLYLVFHVHP